MNTRSDTAAFSRLAMRLGSGLALSGLSIAVGCGTVTESSTDYEAVTSLEGLELDRAVDPTRLYVRPNAAELGTYSNFIVGPILIDYRDPEMEELSVETVRRLEDTLQTSIIEELEEHGYTVGTKAKPGTLRMSFIISGFSAPASGAAVNAAAIAAGAVVGAPSFVTISVGEVTVEGIFSDAYNRQVDAVAIARSRGSRFFDSNPLSTWEDVEEVFGSWAEGIRNTIESTRSDGS